MAEGETAVLTWMADPGTPKQLYCWTQSYGSCHPSHPNLWHLHPLQGALNLGHPIYSSSLDSRSDSFQPSPPYRRAGW